MGLMQSQTRTRLQCSDIPQSNKALPKSYFETKIYSAGKSLTEI